MADAGVYLAVSRNDQPLPDIVHSAIYPATPEGRAEAEAKANELWENTKRRIPFRVVEIRTGYSLDDALTDAVFREQGVEWGTQWEIPATSLIPARTVVYPETSRANAEETIRVHREVTEREEGTLVYRTRPTDWRPVDG